MTAASYSLHVLQHVVSSLHTYTSLPFCFIRSAAYSSAVSTLMTWPSALEQACKARTSATHNGQQTVQTCTLLW